MGNTPDLFNIRKSHKYFHKQHILILRSRVNKFSTSVTLLKFRSSFVLQILGSWESTPEKTEPDIGSRYFGKKLCAAAFKRLLNCSCQQSKGCKDIVVTSS
jgi:hypothetical protein